ncbi:hypothetical protein LCGC14_1200960 [marine sediment metagenome]|uniref:Uncharacterized protein n=1 Tax=marine sediment metagenome TaxID=412755 RepID=A0A0F9NZC2_9ZZZZ
MAIDDGGQVASITYRAALIMSLAGGLVSRETIPGGGKPEVIARQSCDMADAIIKRIRETERPQETPKENPPQTDG